MKQTIINIRTILAYLNTTDYVSCKAVSKYVDLSSEDTIEALKMLCSFKFVRNRSDGHWQEVSFVEIEDKGKNFAEDLKNEERWQKIMSICNDMDDYSLNTVLQILDGLIRKEITEHINE